MELTQIKGLWWLPGERRKRNAVGTVTYSPKTGSSLEVFGKRLVADDRSFYVPVIHGDTENGPVTLLNCIFEQWTFHGKTDNVTQNFTGQYIIVGARIRENTLFGWANVRLRYLDDWSRMGSIKDMGQARQHIPNAGPGFYYEHEQNLSAAIAGSSTITLGARTQGHIAANATSLRIEHELSLRLATSKSLANLVDAYVSPLVDLITLIVDQPSSVLSLQVAPRRRTRDQTPTPFDYYDVGLTTGVDLPASDSVTSPGTQVVPRAEFDFQTEMPQWFDLATSLRGIRGLVFGLRYASQMNVENRFLNASMAAEALHRATVPSRRARVSFKNEATRVWLSRFPEDERQLIRARVNQYVNDPSLANRLSELVEKAGSAFRILAPDTATWVKMVKDIRNDLTHQEGAPKVRINSAEMFVLAESVAMLVYTCLLIDLGHEPDVLKDMLMRPMRIRVLQSELKAFLPAS